jgi:hypothetical protein
MCGGVKMQPNLRAVPAVIDPFAVTKLDAVLASIRTPTISTSTLPRRFCGILRSLSPS